MELPLKPRQTTALDLCPYVSWDEYNWHDIIQCNGYDDGVKIPWNPAVYCIIASTHAVAMYMCLELLVRTVRRFQKWNALYPWALLCTELGLVGIIVTYQLSLFVLKPGNKGWTALNIICSVCFLSGFDFMLYSRLHIVIPAEHRWVRRAALILLIVNTFLFHTPPITATIIGTYGSQKLAYNISKHVIYIDIGFAGQDILLTSLYIFYFARYMRANSRDLPQAVKADLRKMLMVLLAAYAVVWTSAILSLVLLGKTLWLARGILSPLINAINLQVEFFTLNRLVQTANLKNEALQRGNLDDLSVYQISGYSPHRDNRVDSKPEFRSLEPDIRNVEVAPCYFQNPNAQQSHDLEAIDPAAPPSPSLDALERQYLGPVKRPER